jgi:hypothetical protein
MEKNNKQDIRLYVYYSGTLKKVGFGKNKNNPHKFSSLEECEKHILYLRTTRLSSKQYVIVEYFDDYTSKILKIN